MRYTGLADLGDDVPCPELVDDLLPLLRRLLAPSGDLGLLGHLLSLDGSLSKVSSHLGPCSSMLISKAGDGLRAAIGLAGDGLRIAGCLPGDGLRTTLCLTGEGL